MAIDVDGRKRFDPDCSTCAHRAERHPSRRQGPDRPRRLGHVCMVCGKAIGEHGTWTQHTERVGGHFMDTHSEWVQDVPCKAYDKGRGEWYALDWEEADDA